MMDNLCMVFLIVQILNYQRGVVEQEMSACGPLKFLILVVLLSGIYRPTPSYELLIVVLQDPACLPPRVLLYSGQSPRYHRTSRVK